MKVMEGRSSGRKEIYQERNACRTRRLALVLAATKAEPTSPTVLIVSEPTEAFLSAKICCNSIVCDSTANLRDRPATTSSLDCECLEAVSSAARSIACNGSGVCSSLNVILPSAPPSSGIDPDVWRCHAKLSAVSDARRICVSFG